MSKNTNSLTPGEIEKILQDQGLLGGKSRVGNFNKTTDVIRSLYGKEIAKKKSIKRSFFGL